MQFHCRSQQSLHVLNRLPPAGLPARPPVPVSCLPGQLFPAGTVLLIFLPLLPYLNIFPGFHGHTHTSAVYIQPYSAYRKGHPHSSSSETMQHLFRRSHTDTGYAFSLPRTAFLFVFLLFLSQTLFF